MITGNTVVGDSGAGTLYTSQGATSGGPGAVQDASGTWYNIVFGSVLQTANNLSELAGSPAPARTNLGLGSASVLASSAVLQTSNALSELAGSPAPARTNLGLGSAALLASSSVLQTANNLSDVSDTASAKANLGIVQNQHKYSTQSSTSSSTSLVASDIFGGSVEHVLNLTGAITVASNAQLPTVVALVAGITSPVIGQTWKLRFINSGGVGAGVWTITTNTGWTASGGMSILPGEWKDFIVTLTSLTAATFQASGSTDVGLNITTSAIGSALALPNTFMVSGFATPGDMGAGAVYTRQGATSAGLMAIQNASGTWYNLIPTIGNLVILPSGDATGATDVANIQAAINIATSIYNDFVSVVLTGGGAYYFNSTGITLNPNTKLIGNSETNIYSGTGVTSGTFITAPSAVGIGPRSRISNILIHGNAAYGAGGTMQGFSLGDSIELEIDNCNVQNCLVGYWQQGMQYTNHRALRAFQCGVGLYCNPSPPDGGGNENSFYDLYVYACMVGVIFDNSAGLYPLHDIWIHGFSGLVNQVCDIAVLGNSTSGPTCVHLFGCHTETLSNTASYTYNGTTIPNCSIYGNYAKIDILSGSVSSALGAPVFNMVNYSQLQLTNAEPALSGSTFLAVQCDATSEVNFSGRLMGLGFYQNVGSWPNSVAATAFRGTSFYGQPNYVYDDTINFLIADQVASKLSSQYMVSPPTVTFGEVSGLGYCATIAFQTVLGNYGSDINKAYYGCTLAGSMNTVISFYLQSNINCIVHCGLWAFGDSSAISGFNVNLLAGKLTRVVLAISNVPAGAGTVDIVAGDTTGAIVNVLRFSIFQGVIGNAIDDAVINKIIGQGAFNSGVSRDTATNIANVAAPVNTIGKYPGKTVWNSTSGQLMITAGQSAGSAWAAFATSGGAPTMPIAALTEEGTYPVYETIMYGVCTGGIPNSVRLTQDGGPANSINCLNTLSGTDSVFVIDVTAVNGYAVVMSWSSIISQMCIAGSSIAVDSIIPSPIANGGYAGTLSITADAVNLGMNITFAPGSASYGAAGCLVVARCRALQVSTSGVSAITKPVQIINSFQQPTIPSSSVMAQTLQTMQQNMLSLTTSGPF